MPFTKLVVAFGLNPRGCTFEERAILVCKSAQFTFLNSTDFAYHWIVKDAPFGFYISKDSQRDWNRVMDNFIPMLNAMFHVFAPTLSIKMLCCVTGAKSMAWSLF